MPPSDATTRDRLDRFDGDTRREDARRFASRAGDAVIAAGGGLQARQRRSATTSPGTARGQAVALDSLQVVRPLLTATRWGTLAVGFTIAVSSHRHTGALAWGLALAGYALLRTFRPLRFREGRPLDLAAVLGEVALTMVVVVTTGYWSSPYFFCLATAVIAAGFARGFAFGTIASLAAAVAVATPFQLRSADASLRLSMLGTGELLLIAIVTGYARRLFGEAEARTSLALDRLSRLTDANALLQELHHVAQSLPATLDLNETVSSLVTRMRELLQPDVIVVLLHEAGSYGWTVAGAEGARLDASVADSALPAPLLRAVRDGRVVMVEGEPGDAGWGLSPPTAAAIYLPLRARGALVGVLAVESRDPGGFGPAEAALLERLGEQAALALDNARWFGKLRTIGAEEERNRIARDLHDRVGQSLAYLAFELDRIGRRAEDEAVRRDVQKLREDVRLVVGEVRDTLYDLRTDVSESRDLAATVEAFLHRVQQRAGVRAVLRAPAGPRLALPQERELWRIAQEAVTNAERHAGATTITVTWRCDDDGAELEVLDDGRGFQSTQIRPDSYGIVGMRERASSIGATLTVDSEPGRGTAIRCFLPR